MSAGRAWDAIVVGLGAMSSAAAYHLARRGRRADLAAAGRTPHPIEFLSPERFIGATPLRS